MIKNKYYNKYNKYKNKYINLKNKLTGGTDYNSFSPKITSGNWEVVWKMEEELYKSYVIDNSTLDIFNNPKLIAVINVQNLTEDYLAKPDLITFFSPSGWHEEWHENTLKLLQVRTIERIIGMKKSTEMKESIVELKESNDGKLEEKQSVPKYRDSYDPQIFIDILEENNIDNGTNKEGEIKAQLNSWYENIDSNNKGPPPNYVSFDKINEYIQNSCNRLKDNLDTSVETILLIPFVNSFPLGLLRKSNFYFSLLYLKKLKEMGIDVSNVVLFMSTSSINKFFNENENVYNILLCDDGSYSGVQLEQTLREIYNYKGILNNINKIHVCLPFCVKSCINYVPNKLVDFRDYQQKQKIELNNSQSNNKNKIKLIDNSKFKSNSDSDLLQKKKIVELIDENYNDIRLLFGNIIVFHIGAQNFNQNLNTWFYHKIPDFKSFYPNLRNEYSTFGFDHNPPYKIKWEFCKEVIDRNILNEVTNPNEYIYSLCNKEFKFKRKKNSGRPIIEDFPDNYEPKTKIAQYIINLEKLENDFYNQYMSK
jgi:hypothetical protein